MSLRETKEVLELIYLTIEKSGRVWIARENTGKVLARHIHLSKMLSTLENIIWKRLS